jgi:hypothetical protein
MRDSDTPPPGAPSMRGSRVFALLIIAVILAFVIWFAARNWGVREPGRNTSGPGVQQSGGRGP